MSDDSRTGVQDRDVSLEFELPPEKGELILSEAEIKGGWTIFVDGISEIFGIELDWLKKASLGGLISSLIGFLIVATLFPWMHAIEKAIAWFFIEWWLLFLPFMLFFSCLDWLGDSARWWKKKRSRKRRQNWFRATARTLFLGSSYLIDSWWGEAIRELAGRL